MRFIQLIIVVTMLWIGLIGNLLSADEPMPNIPTPTAGGLQFWSDHRVRDGFRVQQNSVTGRWRLIDPRGVRLAWGDKRDCIKQLDQRRRWTADDDDGRTATVLLHGLGRSRHCMGSLAAAITAGGGHPIAVGYSSSRREVCDHAKSLHEVLADWPGSWKLRFVGHSMGNIVTRHWVGDRIADPETSAMLDRCESMVMLGPPNQGSSIAKRLGPTGLFGLIAGDGGMQMGPRFEDLQKSLAIPPFPFAVVAGDVSHYLIGNPLLDGPNDLVVTVAETKLDKMAQHHIVPIPHATLMTNPDSVALTIQLLGEL